MKDKIIYYDLNNEKKEGTLILSLEYKNNKYIVYTDNYRNSKNELKLLASRIEEKDGITYTYPIETDDEWNYIEKLIKKMEDINYVLW